MDYDSLLNEGETLSHVKRYEVGRQEGRILIDLHEVLAGKSDARFIAMPFLTFVGRSKYEFYGHGSTEDEALRDCLSKIKNESYDDITGINSKQVTIRCPRTGKNVPTGVAMDEESFKSATLKDNSVQCPHCGEMHTWQKKDAFLV
jgi:endogenous inhibitor of DNA gyrase (YacG/DUF329 family)